MKKNDVEALYPLSPMQQGMLFHTLYDPQSEVYFEQFNCDLCGDLCTTAFKKGWQQVIDRHSILRTLFLWKDLEKPLQVVLPQVTCPWTELDWREFPLVEQQSRLERFLQEDRLRGINLAQAPVMRLALIRMTEECYHFTWSFHHMLLDGWSFPVVLKEVFAFYEGNIQGKHVYLEQSRPYKDYINWLQKQDIVQAETFWREKLKGLTAPTSLVVSRKQEQKKDQKARYIEHNAQITMETTAALQSFARRQRLTVNTIIQGVWALLLHHYSGKEDIVFGATVSGYPVDLAGAEVMIGLFINTLPVRVQVQRKTWLPLWLKELQIQQAEARQYAYISLTQIQGWSSVPWGQPLFESLVIFENYPVDASLGEIIGGLEMRHAYTVEKTNYPLTLLVTPTPKNMLFKLSYDSTCFDADVIIRLQDHLFMLLEEIVANPERYLSDLPLITVNERRLLNEWNSTRVEYPQACFHQLFEQQVQRTPDALALVYEEESLTYRALNQRANQLSYALQELGVGPEVCVGLCLERSLEMVIGLLAILKAGGAYVPLDPTYPQERLALMTEDSEISVLLTFQTLLSRLPASKAIKVCLDTDQPRLEKYEQHNPISSVSPDHLAYIIYTSGSTGRPKGVQIPHRALVNFCHSMRRYPGLTSHDTLLAVTTLSFDIAGLELYLPLLVGARVVIATHDVATNGQALAQTLNKNKATVMQATPVTWRLLLASGWQGDADFKALCGGETLSAHLAEQLSSQVHRLYNMYGPTETTIWSTIGHIQAQDPITIGRPIANTQVYILDAYLHPVPLGVPGELYIGGDGLARGYLHLPELTQERFIPHPFSADPQARLYRTGDLARYREDGAIEHLGRLDRQIKMHGYRIELGEIEEVLARHDALQECAVVVHEDSSGDQRLIAYVVAHQERQPVTAEILHQYLAASLPMYMLPSAFVLLEKLPLTPNGKVDHRSLPAPEQTGLALTERIVEPANPIEEVLVNIWAEILNLERVGTHNSFFALGGHSLLAIRLIARINKIFRVDLPLRSLFDRPTIAGQARQLIDYEVVQGSTLKIAQLRKRVGSMSLEEVRATLQSRERSTHNGE